MNCGQTMEKETLFEKRMKELSKNAYYRGVLTFSDFLDLNELHMLQSLPKNGSGVKVETFGGYALAERQMAAFIPDALFFQQDYPISCIRIRPAAEKFAESLTHRDYLGAILNLGIERNKIGDILVEGKTAHVFCHENMAPFLLQELCRVRHTNVVPELLNALEELPSLKTEKISGTVSSVRLDSVIALAFSSSRSSMISLIEGGKVFVNGKNILSNGYNLKVGDIVSVRGKGKFRFEEVGGITKKNRYHISLARYC